MENVSFDPPAFRARRAGEPGAFPDSRVVRGPVLSAVQQRGTGQLYYLQGAEDRTRLFQPFVAEVHRVAPEVTIDDARVDLMDGYNEACIRAVMRCRGKDPARNEEVMSRLAAALEQFGRRTFAGERFPTRRVVESAIVLPDRPGSLLEPTTVIADLGLSIRRLELKPYRSRCLGLFTLGARDRSDRVVADLAAEFRRRLPTGCVFGLDDRAADVRRAFYRRTNPA